VDVTSLQSLHREFSAALARLNNSILTPSCSYEDIVCCIFFLLKNNVIVVLDEIQALSNVEKDEFFRVYKVEPIDISSS